MAVQLFLNGTEVVIDSTQQIRITKENPYFTLSDSYTLDVSIPLYILQNRQFFGQLNRIDKSKQYSEYSCRLLCANTLILEGTAHIVQVTDLLVKVQLACGVSALKMSAEQEGTYIDSLITESEGSGAILTQNLDFGPTVGENHTGFGFPVLDSTNSMVVNIGTMDAAFGRGFPYVSECPRLLDVARLVAAKIGYTIDMSALPAACSNIYIVSATHGNLGKKIPHWTVKEFLREFQNFFGCTMVRSGNKSLRMVPLDNFINNPVTVIEPLNEFQADYSQEDDAEGIMNRNVEFEMEGSGTEIVDEEILGQAKYTEEYNSALAMSSAFQYDAEEVKMHKIYKLNGESYIGWQTGENSYALKRVAPFNPLKRFDSAESIKLKIAPAYIEEDVECVIGYIYDIMGGYEQHKFSIHMPSVSNPFGQSINWGYDASGGSQESGPTLQSLVEGSESVVSSEDKTDIMSVAFLDGREETVTTQNEGGYRQATFKIHLAFTDSNFKQQLSNNRSKWSFSLNPLVGYDFYLGQLHRVSFRCSHSVKHVFKFLADAIPDPTNIFIVHGKRFACEKIEAGVIDGQLNRLMTGYFYEIL